MWAKDAGEVSDLHHSDRSFRPSLFWNVFWQILYCNTAHPVFSFPIRKVVGDRIFVLLVGDAVEYPHRKLTLSSWMVSA